MVSPLQLDKLEFRAVLVSLGFNIPEVPPTEAGKDAEFERVLARVDPNGKSLLSVILASLMSSGDGTISFDEYIAFMADEHADAETSAQLFDAFKVIAGDKVEL